MYSTHPVLSVPELQAEEEQVHSVRWVDASRRSVSPTPHCHLCDKVGARGLMTSPRFSDLMLIIDDIFEHSL